MRMNLKVPFAEKDQAKKLGARWDAAHKLWYVAGADNLEDFARWSPTPHAGGDIIQPQPAGGAARTQASGRVFVGQDYVPAARVCECLPWDVCSACAPTALRLPLR